MNLIVLAAILGGCLPGQKPAGEKILSVRFEKYGALEAIDQVFEPSRLHGENVPVHQAIAAVLKQAKTPHPIKMEVVDEQVRIMAL